MTKTRLRALVGVLLAALLITPSSIATASAAGHPGKRHAAAKHKHAATHKHKHKHKTRHHKRTHRIRPAAPATAASAAPSTVPAAACPDRTTEPTAANLAAIRASILCLVNAERAAQGMAALRDNAQLAAAAAGHANDMVARGFFDHTTPEGVDFSARIRAAGYTDYATIAENLAWGTGSAATPAETVASWMASPGHRANILTPDLRESGIGVAMGVPAAGLSGGATYAQEFGLRSA